MKRIYLWIIMPFLISCTADGFDSEPLEHTLQNSLKTGIQYPYNPANGFDQAGALHNELSESYVVGGALPTTVGATLASVDSIAGQNALFHMIKGPGYAAPSVSRLEYILEQSETDFSEILSNSSLSESARADLIGFIEDVHYLETSRAAYDSIYSYITTEEDKIMNSTTYSQSDKQLLLVTTSVTRHASYFAREQKKKPRDKDWDLVIANIIAAADGAEQGSGKAAVMAATAGIVSNY